jgi:hypothetical protein
MDGVRYDHQLQDSTLAYFDAEKEFAEKCVEKAPRDGEVFTTQVKFIGYEYDDDGEMQVTDTLTDIVVYEHHRSDREEHSTMHRGVGGVL